MIIGLSGFAGSGKDTAAQYLVEDYGYKRIAFADPVREVAEAIDPYVGWAVIDYGHNDRHTHVYRYTEAVEEYGYQEAKEEFPETRRLLQRIGTEAGRDILGEDIWVKTAFNKFSEGEDICFSDLRFPNEEQAVRDAGGVVVWIEREELNHSHRSETEMVGIRDRADFTIDNTKDLDHLYQQLNSLVEQLHE